MVLADAMGLSRPLWGTGLGVELLAHGAGVWALSQAFHQHYEGLDAQGLPSRPVVAGLDGSPLPSALPEVTIVPRKYTYFSVGYLFIYF